MKPFEITGLPPDELNSFLSATHADPFRVLGPHRLGDDLAIRIFRPDVQKVAVVLNGQSAGGTIEAEKVHGDGFFCAKVPGATRDLDYHLQFTGPSGQEWTTRDPYRYGPIMGEVDLHLFAEGQHWKIYDKFGAHVRTIGAASGGYFSVWAPTAHGVSAVGGYNGSAGEDDRRRKLGGSGEPVLLFPG